MEGIPFVEYFKEYLPTFIKEAENEGEVSPSSVLKEGHENSRKLLYSIMDGILEEGSKFIGAENAIQFLKEVKNGKKGIILAEHYSNFDYPMFAYLLEKAIPEGKELIDATYAIAGIKLNEENKYISSLAAAFNRIFIYPATSMEKIKDENTKAEEEKKAKAINLASMRVMDKLRTSGHPILVFPSGTRYRPGHPETKRGRREIDSYIKSSDLMLLLSINGNCLHLCPSNNMEQDLIFKDKMIVSASKIYDCKEFRDKIKNEKKESLDIKQDVVDCVMNILSEMHEEVEKKRLSL